LINRSDSEEHPILTAKREEEEPILSIKERRFFAPRKWAIISLHSFNNSMRRLQQNSTISRHIQVLKSDRGLSTGKHERLVKMLKNTEEWRKRQEGQIEQSKYMLVHFTKNKGQKTDAPIEINGTIIRPSTGW